MSFPPLKGVPQWNQIGFGTYRANGSKCQSAILNALKIGYNRIDTAAVYRKQKQTPKKKYNENRKYLSSTLYWLGSTLF
jgi:diketogulonate reductase-like aldo/keto reductase